MSKRRIAAFIFVLLLSILTVSITLVSCGGKQAIGENDAGGKGNLSGVDNGENTDENNAGNGNEEMTVKITVAGKNIEFTAELYDNAAAKKLYARLPLNIDMSDMPHEKYCYLDFSLPVSEERPRNIRIGDIMLWGDNCLVLFYEDFTTSYSYTRIGKIVDVNGLVSALKGNAVLKIEAVD